jgi:hypothetical protein
VETTIDGTKSWSLTWRDAQIPICSDEIFGLTLLPSLTGRVCEVKTEQENCGGR